MAQIQVRYFFSSVAITYDGDYIVAREGNNIYLFNKEGEVLWNYKIEDAINPPLLASVSITSDGTYIAAGGEDGKVHILSNEGMLLRTFITGSVSKIDDVAVTPDGNYIAAGSQTAVYLFNKEGEVLWKYNTNGLIRQLPFFASISVTSDGNYIAATIRRDKLCLLSDGLLLWKYHIDL